MHPRGLSRRGVLNIVGAVLVAAPTLVMTLESRPASATSVVTRASAANRSGADRLVAVLSDARRRASALQQQAKAIEQTVQTATGKVVKATTAATRRAVDAGAVIQNITTGGPTTTLAPKPTSTATIGVAALGPVTVAQLDQTFVDTTRATPANGSSAPRTNRRTLATTVLYPTDAPAGTTFPVLVFGHGLGGNPKRYIDLLRPIASAGYIVVAPTFPLSNSATVGGATVTDEPQQPGDLRFAMDQVVALGAQPGNPLAGIVDGTRLAAAGHSLGGITTLDYAYGSGFDRRLRAAIPISSILNPFSSAAYFTKPMIPLLLIHGDADDTVPYALGSVTAFATAPSPKALLTIRNGTHSFGLSGTPGASPAVGSAVVSAMVDFLDRYLKDDPTGINRLQVLATGQPGLLRLDAAGL